MSGNVDVPGSYVNVHEIVDDPALDVALVFVDQNFLSGVENLDEAVVLLDLLVDGFVLKFVVLDALAEVLHNVICQWKNYLLIAVEAIYSNHG